MKMRKKLFGMLLCVMVMTGFMAVTAMGDTVGGSSTGGIKSVTINNLDYPVAGQTLDTTYELPAGGIKYEKVNDTGVTWYTQTAGQSGTTEGTEIPDVNSHEVSTGDYYMAKVELCDVRYQAASGDYTYFYNNVAVEYNPASRLNGSKVTVNNQYNCATVYLFFQANGLYNNSVNGTGIDVETAKVADEFDIKTEESAQYNDAFKVAAGTTPWTKDDMTWDTEGYDVSLAWYKGIGDSKSAIGQEETFVAGQKYTLRLTVDSDKAGSLVTFDTTEFAWGLYINQAPGEIYQRNPLKYVADFVCVAQGAVDEVSIEGIRNPEAYADMQTTGFTVNDGVKISEVQWYQISGVQHETDVSGKFQPNTQYRLKITIEPEDGYTFNFEQGDISVNAGDISINGYSAGVIIIDFAIGEHTCSYPDTWEKDATNHWKTCACGEKDSLAAHTFDAGVVTKQATETATGVKTYTCSVCGYTKTEEIAKLEKKEEKPAAPAEGEKLTDGAGITYKVTKSGETVEYAAPKNKKVTRVTIPATVTIDGITYNVTGIAKNAFKGCSKLKSVTIGKNVETIGAKAFYGCKKLKTITIKTTKLTSKTVGKNAFKGTVKNAKVKVPKKSLKVYKKFFYKKGLNKKAKIKK